MYEQIQALVYINILPTRLGRHNSYELKEVFYGCPSVALFYQHGLTLNPAWISNYMYHKVWDELTYPFPNFNGYTVEFAWGVVE